MQARKYGKHQTLSLVLILCIQVVDPNKTPVSLIAADQISILQRIENRLFQKNQNIPVFLCVQLWNGFSNVYIFLMMMQQAAPPPPTIWGSEKIHALAVTLTIQTVSLSSIPSPTTAPHCGSRMPACRTRYALEF